MHRHIPRRAVVRGRDAARQGSCARGLQALPARRGPRHSAQGREVIRTGDERRDSGRAPHDCGHGRAGADMHRGGCARREEGQREAQERRAGRARAPRRRTLQVQRGRARALPCRKALPHAGVSLRLDSRQKRIRLRTRSRRQASVHLRPPQPSASPGQHAGASVSPSLAVERQRDADRRADRALGRGMAEGRRGCDGGVFRNAACRIVARRVESGTRERVRPTVLRLPRVARVHGPQRAAGRGRIRRLRASRGRGLPGHRARRR